MGAIQKSYQIQIASGKSTLTRDGSTQSKNSRANLEAWKSLLEISFGGALVDFLEVEANTSLELRSTYSLAAVSCPFNCLGSLLL